MKLPLSTTWLPCIFLLALTTSVSSPARAGVGDCNNNKCIGDCNNDGEVTVDEAQVMVAAALGIGPIGDCENGDYNSDGAITVDEILAAINTALCFDCCVQYIPPQATCGDGFLGCGEECDDGGRCIGGRNDGSACRFDFDCDQIGPGVCAGGSQTGGACLAHTDCPGGACLRCVPVGGDGCAVNCTTETIVRFDLVPGTINGSELSPGTSGATVYGEIIPQLPLPLRGAQTLTIGKQRDGLIPVVIKAASVDFPQIPVSNIACACVRAVEARTCGGTLLVLDGVTPTADCTSQDDCAALGLPPCTAVHGPGNSASGWLACEGEAQDASVTQDCNSVAGGIPRPPWVELTGARPILLSSVQLGVQVGPCTPTFCTAADPPAARGPVQTVPITTGAADARVVNANGFPGFDLGPHGVVGAPLDCTALRAPTPRASGAALVAALTACDQPNLNDIVTTIRFVAQ